MVGALGHGGERSVQPACEPSTAPTAPPEDVPQGRPQGTTPREAPVLIPVHHLGGTTATPHRTNVRSSGTGGEPSTLAGQLEAAQALARWCFRFENVRLA